MPTFENEAQAILGYVYTVTDKGHYLLLRSGATLPQIEQELLIRIDGRTTRDQLFLDMEYANPVELGRTLESLMERGLIAESNIRLPEDTSLDFTGDFGGPAAPVMRGLGHGEAIRLEAERGAFALDQQGYYISIARRAAAPRPPRNGSTYSILVIEDDVMTAKLLRLLLVTEEFDVDIARNREEIRSSLSLSRLPDAVLMDVMLPDANGFQLLAGMRAHPSYRDIPLVMLTAKASREDVLEGLACGADGYITKPFDMDRVVDVIRDVLGSNQEGA